jgi:arylsulfatase A
LERQAACAGLDTAQKRGSDKYSLISFDSLLSPKFDFTMMKRKTYQRTILRSGCLQILRLACWTILFLAGASSAIAQNGTAEQPNVIILYADDLGYGDLSCYGATKVRTPNIDRLAENGLRFTNGHAAASTCTPSRYSLLTGKYAWRKKGTNILPGNASLIIPTDGSTLPAIFKKSGYTTAAIGKWHLGLGNGGEPDWNGEIKPGPNETGFDYAYFFPATADRVPTVFIENSRVVALDTTDPIAVNYERKIGNDPTGKEHPELLKMQSTPGQGHDGTIVNGIGRIGFMSGGKRSRWADEELADVFVSKAEDFITDHVKNDHAKNGHEKQPFFLYLALSDIHVPRMPGTPFKGSSKLGYRGDAILEMDYSVGRIMKTLDYLGLTKNTIVIFSSDNGPVEDDGYQDGAVALSNGHKPAGPMRGGKYSILEGGTRIPFIVNWPGTIRPGVSDALISQTDLLASFSFFTGQSPHRDSISDSYNIMPALLGKSVEGRPELVEQGASLAIVKGDWKYIAPHAGSPLFKAVNIESGLSLQPQLYNLRTDIGEHINVAAQHPDIVTVLSALLEKIQQQ